MKKLDGSTLIGVGQDFERIRRITGYLVGEWGFGTAPSAQRKKTGSNTL